MYELQYKKKAIKALAKINDPYYTAIIEAIDELAENPRPNFAATSPNGDVASIKIILFNQKNGRVYNHNCAP